MKKLIRPQEVDSTLKSFPKLLFLGPFLIFLFIAVPLAVSGELIQPTRTLQSSEKTPGKISVFSEPPGLDVFLNQSKIGKTPILFMEVKPGTYNLKVKAAETQIYVNPGESLRLSLFKDSFIHVKEQQEETIQKPEKETAGKKPDEPAQKKKEYQPEYDPGYWPLKPGGPIK
jgi:hypothetical protein